MPYLPDHMIDQPDQWAFLAYQETINLKETVMARIDRLEALIKSEVGEALATMQQRVDDALASADASDEEREAVQAEFDTFQERVDNLGDRIEAEGLFGQDENTPEPAPEPNPDEPELPVTEPEPAEHEPDNGGDDTPATEPPTDPGAGTF